MSVVQRQLLLPLTRRARRVGIGAFALLALCRCLPSAPSTKATPARSAEVPRAAGDTFFRGVVSGRLHERGRDVSGTVAALLVGGGRPWATADAAPSTPSAQVRAWLDDGSVLALAGDFVTDAGAATMTDGEWTLRATFGDGVLEGTLSKGSSTKAPDDLARLWIAARGDPDGRAQFFCGAYDSPLAAGRWNVVIADDGVVEGELSGDAFGYIVGVRSASTLTLDWFGESSVGRVTGSATGTVAATTTLAGTWTARAGLRTLSGTFSSEGSSCPAQPFESATTSACPCARSGAVPAGGACCRPDADPLGPWACCLPPA